MKKKHKGVFFGLIWRNFAPDADSIVLKDNGFEITIAREANGKITVDIRHYNGRVLCFTLGDEEEVFMP